MNHFEYGFFDELDKLASFGSNGRRDISAELAQYLLNKEAALSLRQKLMVPVLGAAALFGGKAGYDEATKPNLDTYRAKSTVPQYVKDVKFHRSFDNGPTGAPSTNYTTAHRNWSYRSGIGDIVPGSVSKGSK
ncbi:MAG: hypothetical protein EBU84_04550 [Actinobacteria bacterium]|nr:hypothetical protein [Actinomycetota bacterium]